MHKRLNDFLDINNVIHPLQFGFRQKHSTTHALTSLTEKIKQTIDKGNYGCGVFIDLKKAFDTVNQVVYRSDLPLSQFFIRISPSKYTHTAHVLISSIQFGFEPSTRSCTTRMLNLCNR